MVKPKTTSRPIIRWAGSKRQLLPYLRALAPSSFERYVEPFAGSACFLFDLAPKSAIIGDINRDLMTTYRQVRGAPLAIHESLASLERTESEYYRIREIDPKTLSAFQRSVRFLYLNRNCFNAVYRVNKKGYFNVPWGNRTGSNPSADDFRSCASVLRRTKIMTSDFEEVLAQVRSGDFVYLDPPYSTSTAGEPGLFGAGSFTRQDLLRLVAATRRIDKAGAKYLLSFEYDADLIRELHGTRHETILAQRHVSGFSGARGKVKELVFSNIPREKQ